MKGGDGAAVTSDAEALVQCMKQIGGWCAIFPQQAAGSVARKTIGERAQEAMRPIAEQVTTFPMGTRQAEQDLTRVHSDAREISSQAVGGVKSDFQSASIAVFARMGNWPCSC